MRTTAWEGPGCTCSSISLDCRRSPSATFEAHDFVADASATAVNRIEMVIDGRSLLLDLSELGGPPA